MFFSPFQQHLQSPNLANMILCNLWWILLRGLFIFHSPDIIYTLYLFAAVDLNYNTYLFTIFLHFSSTYKQ